MKCKNCGKPIEQMTEYVDTGFQPYWRHVRDVHMGRIWCYPNAQQGFEGFDWMAEPIEDGDANGN